jgi:two-component system OmpR family sensor kinase
VFERFYRGDPARSRDTGGAGLGLSIVAAIVGSHGGTVTAVPRDGTGTTFEVRLPRLGISTPAP